MLEWEVPIWLAFCALTRQRSSGFLGGEPISVVDARAYLEAKGYGGRALGEALDMLIMLDGVNRECSEKRETEGKKDGKGGNAPPVR